MLDRYEWPGGLARFTLVDMRELDGEPLLASPQPGDNILAILTRLSDQRAAVHQIVRKIADLERPQAVFYAESLLGLAGLRGLRSVIAEELRKNMAFDFVELLAENEVLEPYFRKAREEGLQAGRQEGQHEGQLGLLRRQVERRFGPIPNWAEVRLTDLAPSQIEEFSLKILDAQNVEDLFPKQ